MFGAGDPDTEERFFQLRWLGLVTFIGLSACWLAVFVWIAWRIGPGGYSAEDAQIDRFRMCELVHQLHPKDTFKCPFIVDSEH